jgi:hypothetical protein
MMLAEGYLDLQPPDIESGGAINPLVTPSGTGLERR